MPRQPKKTDQRKHWVLSNKMRTWFIKNGWDVDDQFRVDKMMQMEDFFERHPLTDKDKELLFGTSNKSNE